MRKIICGKLHSRRGTTLIELLAAVAVMIFFSLIINTGMSLAIRTYHTMASESETQILLSMAADVITDELRYARNVETDGSQKVTGYCSETFGEGCCMDVDSEGRLILLESGAGGSDGVQLLASGVYGTDGEYKIDLPDGIAYDKDTAVFTFKIEIKEKEEKRAESTLQIRSINGAAQAESEGESS